MTSKFLMITTAIVALAAAPAVQAEGTKASGTAKTTMSGQATATKTNMSAQTTTGTKAKVMTQTSAKKDMRGLRAQEVEMTRTLNRDSAAGRQVGQMSQTTMPGQMPTQGATLPPPDFKKSDETNGTIGAATGANQ